MEEEKLMKMKQKGKKGRNKEVGAKILSPKLSQELSQLSQTSKKKKKNSNSKFSSFFQIPNFQFKIFIPKFSILHSQCPNSKLKFSVSKKNSNLRFHNQNFKP